MRSIAGRSSEAVSMVATRACPFCAETIKEAAILCRFCGRDLPRPGAVGEPGPTATPAALEALTETPAAIPPSEVFELLTGLVEKSLVIYEEDEQGKGRYRLLET